MATRKTGLVTLSIWLLVIAPCCLAQVWPWQQSRPHQTYPQHGRQRHQFHGQQQNQCDIQRLTAAEPSQRIRAEAGVTEIWDQEDQQFQCAGVVAVRHTIEPGGLFLPSYTNAPYITYVVQGRGLHGVIFPGCPETFESSSSSSSEDEYQSQSRRHSRRPEGRRFEQDERYPEKDQHQKISRIRPGDVITSLSGLVQWTYNNGDEPLVSVTILDTSNVQNQLDQNLRGFYLAGQSPLTSGQQQGIRRQSHQSRREGRESLEEEQQFSSEGGNIFSGFDTEILQQVFPNVERETISNLQGENDDRGNIVRARGLDQLVAPGELDEDEEYYEQEEEYPVRRHRRGPPRSNGVEESICNLRYKHNINRPSQPDVFNPKAGRIHTLNSFTLPILRFLRLSAERVVLYKNAIVPPQWNINAHGIIYVTRGNGRIQVVNHEGRSVFDDRVEEGQILVVPQNFAAVKKAGSEGFEFISFKTNDNAMVSPLAGRTSVLRGLPSEVLAAAYQISTKEAQQLKYSRKEIGVFRPLSSEQSLRQERVE